MDYAPLRSEALGMARTDYNSVDDYIATQPIATQPVLHQVRDAIRGALPDAEERISYQIPSFRQDGGTVIYFAGWKAHYSLYPASQAMVATFADELAPYAISKGTIRFPYDAPVPAELIARVARYRADEVAAARKK